MKSAVIENHHRSSFATGIWDQPAPEALRGAAFGPKLPPPAFNPTSACHPFRLMKAIPVRPHPKEIGYSEVFFFWRIPESRPESQPAVVYPSAARPVMPQLRTGLTRGRPAAADLRALTPPIWEHVNPYGRFELDMTARLPLECPEGAALSFMVRLRKGVSWPQARQAQYSAGFKMQARQAPIASAEAVRK